MLFQKPLDFNLNRNLDICADRHCNTSIVFPPSTVSAKRTLTRIMRTRYLQCFDPVFLTRSWKHFAGAHATNFLKHTRVFVRNINTSIKACQYDVKTGTLKSGNRNLFFDTHAVIRLLEDNGVITPKAETIVRMLLKTSNSTMDTIYNDMVTKVQQEIMLQRVMSQIASVKKEMIILEKSEFSALLAENENIKLELLQLKVQLADDMNKVRSDNKMGMHFEKTRVKEIKSQYEKKFLETRTAIIEMNAEQGIHLSQSNMRIDTEVAGLKTLLEAHKLDTIKYLAGSVFTCLTIVLGFYRIWM